MTAYILISITMLAIAATAKAATPAERLARTVTATHKCQKTIGERPTAFRWRKHSRSYRLWQIRVWQGRLEACRQQNWFFVAACQLGRCGPLRNGHQLGARQLEPTCPRSAYNAVRSAAPTTTTPRVLGCRPGLMIRRRGRLRGSSIGRR